MRGERTPEPSSGASKSYFSGSVHQAPTFQPSLCPRTSNAHQIKEINVPNILKSGTFALCDCTVNRLGHGAMQPAGAGAFGPKEPAAAREVASSTAGAPRNNRLAT